ncbi:MAG: hypothetical protein GW809_00765 [Bacteroidetes bacterium]|nr:hypothetical protein [Bacteroidota bacterium]NCQ10695.1 hypothetical protein [Bacteroidota bacterium]
MLYQFILFLIVQSDTLSKAYSDKWKASKEPAENMLVGLLGSHDLAFVVFGVILIILSVLFFYLFRLDGKLSKIEKQLNINDN